MTTEMSDQLPARQVQAILSQHGAPSYVAADGQVIGMMAWCRREPDGRMVSGTSWEPVGMTLRAVRDWLGY